MEIVRTSTSFVTTVDHHSEEGKDLIAAIRKYIKSDDKERGLSRRVCLKGRMGKNNPNAYKYSIKNIAPPCYGTHSHQTIKLSDALKADVYIYDR
jgi:hypothetical protein